MRMDQRWTMSPDPLLIISATIVATLIISGVVWIVAHRLMWRKLKIAIASLENVSTGNDWANRILTAAALTSGRITDIDRSSTLIATKMANIDNLWALAEIGEAATFQNKTLRTGHEILQECAIRITSLWISQDTFIHNPWAIVVAASIYGRSGHRTRAENMIRMLEREEVQRRIMRMRDKNLVLTLLLLRILRNYQYDTRPLQEFVIAHLEARIMRGLDIEATAALPTVLNNRTAVKTAERIMYSTAPIHVRRIAAWALVRGVE